MLRMAFVGDLHGKIDLMFEKLQPHSPDLVIQIGDFGTYVEERRMDKATRKHGGLGDFVDYYEGRKKFPIPTYFIKGNHEDFDVIEEIRKGAVPNLYYMTNGNVYDFNGLRIGALGGNHSPERYKLDRNHPKLQQSRRKHFNHQDIESLAQHQDIDIIAAHDCPLGSGMLGRHGNSCGSPELTELVQKIRPKTLVHGHYHRYQLSQMGSTKIISLDKIDGRDCPIFCLDI